MAGDPDEIIQLQVGDLLVAPVTFAGGTGYTWSVVEKPSFLGQTTPLPSRQVIPNLPGGAVRAGWQWEVERIGPPQRLLLSNGRQWEPPTTHSFRTFILSSTASRSAREPQIVTLQVNQIPREKRND